jgi:hypothetical protein
MSILFHGAKRLFKSWILRLYAAARPGNYCRVIISMLKCAQPLSRRQWQTSCFSLCWLISQHPPKQLSSPPRPLLASLPNDSLKEQLLRTTMLIARGEKSISGLRALPSFLKPQGRLDQGKGIKMLRDYSNAFIREMKYLTIYIMASCDLGLWK